MTSNPQKPATQGSQPETTQAEDTKTHDLRSGDSKPWRLVRNLLVLARATEVEIKKQAESRVKNIMTEDHVMKRIKDEFKSDYENVRNEVEKLKVWVFTIIILSIGLVFLAGPLIPNIFSLDVLKLNIENLKEDVEDLRRNQL